MATTVLLSTSHLRMEIVGTELQLWLAFHCHSEHHRPDNENGLLWWHRMSPGSVFDELVKAYDDLAAYGADFPDYTMTAREIMMERCSRVLLASIARPICPDCRRKEEAAAASGEDGAS